MTDRSLQVRMRLMHVRVIGPLIAVLVLSVLIGLGNAVAQAARPEPQSTASEWERLPLIFSASSDTISGLFTPASGALFVTTRGNADVQRSDDGGATWLRVPTPRGADLRTIDPTDDAVMYFVGPGGLYKSTDGGATIEPILNIGGQIRTVAVSPAEPSLVYAAITVSSDWGGGRALLFRSRDGGLSWNQIDVVAGGTDCIPYVEVLDPHPGDANRLLYWTGCGGKEGGPSVALRQSLDQGTSWTDVFEPPCGTPRGLVGGRGSRADQFYLFDRATASDCPALGTGSAIFRGDDDGATWSQTVRFSDHFISALAVDPIVSDRIYAGFYLRNGGVKMSDDGGVTWTDLSGPQLGEIGHLALGIDGRNLYAAGRRGLWRLGLRRATHDGRMTQRAGCVSLCSF